MNTMGQILSQSLADNFLFSRSFWLANYYWISLLMFWSLIWKGLALWRSARRSQLNWFVILLIINTVGLLEIFYLVAYHDTREKLKK